MIKRRTKIVLGGGAEEGGGKSFSKPDNRRISCPYSLDRHYCYDAHSSLKCYSTNQRSSFEVEKAELKSKVVVLASTTPVLPNTEKVEVYT